MDKEIKERIAAINSGIIPEGYKKTKVGIVPLDWKVSCLKDLASIKGRIGFRGYTQNDITTREQGVLALSPTNIVNNSLSLEKCTYITQKKYDESPEIKIEKNDIIFTKTGSTFGKTAYLNTINQNATINPQLVIVRCYNSDYQLLLAYNMQSSYFQNRINQIVVGGAVPTLSQEQLSKIHVAFPTDITEIKKMTKILSTQDKLIELQEKKIEQLKELKKAYLQKMFPKKGSKYPELRFKGFTAPWEQRKLGEVIEDSYNGQTPSRANDEYWNGDLNWLASGDLNRGIVTHTTEKITNKGLEDTRLRIVPKGTFVMAITGLEAAGTRGNCGILGIDTALNQSCMALFPNKKILDTKFLFQWYRKVGEEYGINYTQGTKQQSYNAELIQILPISFPNKEEQQKIADYFSNLDSLITIHQRKSEQEKQKKKALMQLLLTGIVRTK